MNEDALRAMIRESIARHLGGAPAQPAAASLEAWHALPFSAHPSHFRYALPASGGPCHIEPGSHCTHCGYCESHGH